MFERNRHLARVCFESNHDGNNGGGNNEGGGQGQRRSSADVLQQYGNDAIRMADRVAELERDNYRYREQKRDLTDRVKALEGKQVPEGAVVLTGDEAQSWQAFSALGKPEDVQAKLAERDTLAREVAATKRDKALAEVAEAAGWNPAPLRRVGADREYELRDVTVDGQATKVPHIKDGDTWQPLADYAAREWADLLPALTATGGGGDTGQASGQVIPRQQGSQGQGQPANAARQYLQSTYKPPTARTG